VDIVRSDEVQALIDEGIFKSIDDVQDMMSDAEKFLPHRCNPRCQIRIGPGINDFRCRKLNNRVISKDNTKHTFMALPNDWSIECLNRFIKIGLASPVTVNADGYEQKTTFNLPYFYPQRHIPPTNPSDDMNISPVEGKTFAACRSMQNIQLLTNCGGVNKYVCKYIGKIDESNYVIINVDGQGQLVTKHHFLHNTKIATSKFNEENVRREKRDASHVQGRCISQMEMLHVMLKYPEIITDLNFINISTLPLELRPAVEKDKKIQISYTGLHDVDDGAYVGCLSNNIRRE
jgi:hypothetical protein